MATSHTDFIPGLVAGADYSSGAAQFTMVGPNGTTANSVVTIGTQGNVPVGVLYNKPKLGQAAEVARGPVVKVMLNATLSAWAEFVSDNTGKAIAGTTGNVYAGMLLEGGVAGDIVSAIFYEAHSTTHP